MARREIVIRQCREHPGGRFESPVRRGRPPTSCAPEYPCSASTTAVAPPKRRTRGATRDNFGARVVADTEATQPSAALIKAKAAKGHLEAQGWTVEGKARGATALITATRGDELLTMAWDSKGELISQDYQLWDSEKPSANGTPASHLPFNVDEIPDGRLAEYLAGMKLTWWNKLAQGQETAYAGKRIEIMHVYDGVGEEVPSDRIIRFIDATGRGYRAFRLGALLKVGGGATVIQRQAYADAMGKDMDDE